MPIPNPTDFMAARLAKWPKWVRDTVQNALAIAQWVGLPATILSFFVDLKWVIDLGNWLVRNAGIFSEALAALGSICVLVVSLWRDFTEPARHLLVELINFPIPPWAFDLATVALLLAIGRLRTAIRFRAALPQLLQQGGTTPADASYSAHLNVLLREAHRQFPVPSTPEPTRREIVEHIRTATPSTEKDVAKSLGLLVMQRFDDLFPRTTLTEEQNTSLARAPLRSAFAHVIAEQAVGREIERQKANQEFALYAACALLCLAALLVDWTIAGRPS